MNNDIVKSAEIARGIIAGLPAPRGVVDAEVRKFDSVLAATAAYRSLRHLRTYKPAGKYKAAIASAKQMVMSGTNADHSRCINAVKALKTA